MCAYTSTLPLSCGPHVDRPYFGKQAPRLASVLAPNELHQLSYPLDEEEEERQLLVSPASNVLEVNSFSDVEMAATLVCLTLSQPVSCVLLPPARPPPASRLCQRNAHHFAGCPQLRRLPPARHLLCSPSPRPLHRHTRP